jgi:hypothetical protein
MQNIDLQSSISNFTVNSNTKKIETENSKLLAILVNKNEELATLKDLLKNKNHIINRQHEASKYKDLLWKVTIGDVSYLQLPRLLEQLIPNILEVHNPHMLKRCEILEELEAIWENHPKHKKLYTTEDQKLVLLSHISTILQSLKLKTKVLNKAQHWYSI